MAIIQALLAALARSAGKFLNTAFGWATTMLFGKVPENRQIYLSGMAFGSVAWLVVCLGVLFPAFGVWLLSFAPLPDWVNRNWVRLFMLIAAVLVPLVVGFTAVKMLDPEQRPDNAGDRAQAVLKGYPYTLGLALTLILMILFAPILKVQTLLRRWTTQHVPAMVEGTDYLQVVAEVQETLEKAGWTIRRERASWMLRLPTKILTLLAGGAIENMVAEKLTVLKSDGLEVVLHPADLVLSGKEKEVMHARVVIAEQLAFSPAHMTWTTEANEVEDRLHALWKETQAVSEGFRCEEAMSRLDRIEHELRCLRTSYEEWEVLYRQKLLVERAILRHRSPAAGDQVGTTHSPAPTPAPSPAPVRQPLRSDHQPSATPGVVALVAGAVLAWIHSRGRKAT